MLEIVDLTPEELRQVEESEKQAQMMMQQQQTAAQEQTSPEVAQLGQSVEQMRQALTTP